jgi:uncharacterized membrane protein YfcA
MAGELIAIVLGLLVGLSLGALGGGGSTLAVPVLVFGAGLQAQDATTASLLVVGAASLMGVGGHYRNGNVRLGVGAAFGAAGIIGSRIGTLLNRSLEPDLLLLAFSALILFVAVKMYQSFDSRADPENNVDEGTPGHRESTIVATRPSTRLDLSAPALARLAGAATAVGLLTGLFGVGGGFAVVPALTLLLGFKPKEAIGTSLIVIAINAAIALAMRTGDLGLDWAVVLPFLATVTLGVVAGTRLAHRLDAGRLTRTFALMLGAVAIYTTTSTLF